MNFFTSNSDSHRRYVFFLLAVIFLLAGGLFGLGIYLQPLDGDLTRVGSFSERQYGWTQPQLAFSRPLYESDHYDKHYDVVVLGDSFSLSRPKLQWQNYVVATTGWSLLTLDVKKITFEQILQNPIFHEKPPRLFIYETVERELPNRLAGSQCLSEPASLPKQTAYTPLISNALDLQQLKSQTQYVARSTAWADIKLGYVMDYLQNNILRAVRGEIRTEGVKVELLRDAPFSSVEKHTLLVFKNDLRKIAWWKTANISNIACRIKQMKDQVEASGRTRFILMAAPDKLTVYTDFLADPKLRNASQLSGFAEANAEDMPRLDLALVSAANADEKDVYLPNDTHWGARGQQIVADTLLNFLRSAPRQTTPPNR